MKLHIGIANTHADGFPRERIPAVYAEAWVPCGHHFDLPRNHPEHGATNGGSIDSPEADLLVCFEKLDKLKRPPTIKEEALVMFDAEWSYPETDQGRDNLRYLAEYVSNNLIPGAVVGMYGHAPTQGEMEAAFFPCYAGKPVQYIGHPKSDFWRFGELVTMGNSAVMQTHEPGRTRARDVLVMSPYPYGSHTETVLGADYIAVCLQAADCGFDDILVWISRWKDDPAQDDKVIRFLEELAEMAGRGN